jgi:hypothetical protein
MTIDNAFNLDDFVNGIYDRMFTKRYSGNELNDWHQITYFGGGNKDKYINIIKKLLNEGFKVKSGFRSSTMIRGSKTHYIFYRDQN